MLMRRSARKRFVNSIILTGMMATLLFSPSLQDATHSFFHFLSQTNCRTEVPPPAHDHHNNVDELISDANTYCEAGYILSTTSQGPLVFASTPILTPTETPVFARPLFHEVVSSVWFYGSHSARGPPHSAS